MNFKNLNQKITDYTELFEMEPENFKELNEHFIKTREKIINKKGKINDNDRYIVQNLLNDMKEQKNASFDATEKQYLIDNKIVSQTQQSDDFKLFKLKGSYYGPNLSIKPTIDEQFRHFKENSTGLQKLAFYINNNFSDKCSIYDEYGSESFLSKYHVSKNPQLNKTGTLYWGYETGGASGGNCWGGEATPYTVKAQIKQEFPALKEFLKDMAPDITFLQYDDLKKYIRFDEITEREYYGNYATYDVEYITAQNLYKGLKEIGYDIDAKIEEKLGDKNQNKNNKGKKITNT